MSCLHFLSKRFEKTRRVYDKRRCICPFGLMQGIRISAIVAVRELANEEAAEELCVFLKIIYFSSQFKQNIISEGASWVTQFNSFTA